MTLKVADIYCGAGGLSKGFELARIDGLGDDEHFQIVYGVDKDRDCMTTYRRNHFHGLAEEHKKVVAPCRSTTGLTGTEILTAAKLDHVDIVVGGPNCQGVSAAGLRNAADPRNERFEEFLQLVTDLRPEWFVMENVPGLTHKNNRHLLYTILKRFAALPEYDVAADVLLATDFGCAQLRYRLFIIGNRTGKPIMFPTPTHAHPIVAGNPQPLPLLLESCQTVEDAIGYLKNIPAAVATEGEPVAVIDDQGNQIRMVNHVVPAMAWDNKERLKSVGQGKDWRSIPVRLLPERYFSTRASDQKGAYGRLAWKYPAFTIISLAHNVSAGPFTHPSLDRPISAREAADLQGFPKDFVFVGEVTSLFRQIGNAVPPPLARAVAESILRCHYQPNEARTWGRQGRITLDLFDDDGNSKAFPILTPRHLLTKPVASMTKSVASTTLPAKRPALRSEATPFTFIDDPATAKRIVPDVDLSRVRREAKLPGNMRAGKRARVIIGYVDGMTLEQLCAESKVSADSIKKWVEGFFHDGPDGWRAYHTPLAALAGEDDALLAKLQGAVDKIRGHDDLDETTDGECSDNSRPHMNRYLRQLIVRYKDQSVDELIEQASKRLGRDVGTVYVGDLLALCHALSESDSAAPQAASASPKHASATVK